jgi:hypothetical protein
VQYHLDALKGRPNTAIQRPVRIYDQANQHSYRLSRWVTIHVAQSQAIRVGAKARRDMQNLECVEVIDVAASVDVALDPPRRTRLGTAGQQGSRQHR